MTDEEQLSAARSGLLGFLWRARRRDALGFWASCAEKFKSDVPCDLRRQETHPTLPW